MTASLGLKKKILVLKDKPFFFFSFLSMSIASHTKPLRPPKAIVKLEETCKLRCCFGGLPKQKEEVKACPANPMVENPASSPNILN